MKKIALINCLKTNEICAGVSCLKAYNVRSDFFAQYQGEETELVAFMRCNGCGAPAHADAGMREKIERLLLIGTDVVHVGVCTKDESKAVCPILEEALRLLQDKGVAVVRGTHRER